MKKLRHYSTLLVLLLCPSFLFADAPGAIMLIFPVVFLAVVGLIIYLVIMINRKK